MADKKITIKLIKSGIGRIKSHKQCIKGLGFRKLNQVIEVEDTPVSYTHLTLPTTNSV